MSETSDTRWSAAVRGLVDRVIGPGFADSVRLTQRAGGERAYQVGAEDGILEVAATDALAACVGLHHYLRAAVGTNVSWDTALPLELSRLPDQPPISATARVQDVYYLNFCTFSYSTAFWTWTEWEREIDWMALHGISMPLAAVGHEAVLYTALQRVGLSEDVVRAHLGSPGYLPFQYMGCLEGVGEPLSRGWIDDHLALGRQILQRERALGMTPVLPAFVGSIPPSLPATDARSRTWQGFNTTVLTPADPLYRQLTGLVAQTQQQLLGTDHLYAADPFIEMVPVDDDPGYPGRVADATLAGLIDADPDAVWVLQSWPFSYQAGFWTDDRITSFLDAIDDQRIRLLDLWAERRPQWRQRNGFDGKPWLWCALLNFGGRTDPVGDLWPLIDEVGRALASPHPPVGLGLTMEGIHNNAMFFELVVDLAWSAPADLRSWLADAAPQRYPRTDGAAARAAWSELAATVYTHRQGRVSPGEFHGVVTARPSYHLLVDSSAIGSAWWFDPARLARAWGLLLDTAESSSVEAPEPLLRDLVDVTAAALLRLADHRALAVIAAATAGQVDEALCHRFLDTFTELDAMLNTRADSRWSTWEDQAARWDGVTDGSAAVRSARRLLTVWGQAPGETLDDYAARIWGGLVGSYYRARWAAWAAGLPDAVHGDRTAAEADLRQRLDRLAVDFVADGPDSTTVPTQDGPAIGATVEVSRRLYDRLVDEISIMPRRGPNPEN